MQKGEKGFQACAEEDDVRLDWKSGKFETEQMRCESCGDRNAWNKVHKCCEGQCTGILNALQAFPFAAWDDISAAPLDPSKVVAARKTRDRVCRKEAGMEENTEMESKGARLESD